MTQSRWLRRVGLLVALAAVYFIAGRLGLNLAFVNVSTTIGATVGVTTLAFTGLARWAEYGAIWWTWWLGDAVGDLVVAPALLLWAVAPRLRWNRAQWIEAAALLLWVVVVGFTVFGGLFPSRVKNYQIGRAHV